MAKKAKCPYGGDWSIECEELARLQSIEVTMEQVYQLVAEGGSGKEYDSSWMYGKRLARKEREDRIKQALRIMETWRKE